ncbi:phosphatidate cytidylyltransferase [Flavobacteriales bacterium]|nr:phosphatidate cytidylyltransferase [Flavobacteriales bacterium]
MLTRAIYGAIFVIVLISAYLGSVESAWALTVLISFLGFAEFSRITRDNKSIKISPLWWITLMLFAFDTEPFGIISEYTSIPLSSFNLLLIPVIAIQELFRKGENPVENIAFGFLSVIYPSLIYFSYLSGFDSQNFNGTTIIGFFILIWSNDTFAYLSGRFFGKTKLFERISPKKTWEGSIGGALCTIGISQILAQFYTQFTSIEWIVISIICVLFGAFGDLVESLIKRNYQIKDSGNLIPGHGGILDRFDATLLASPVLYFFIHYFI